MPYHHPPERRRSDRRVATVPRPGAPERRLADRRASEIRLVRKPEPMHRGVLWAAVVMVMIVADSAFWDGYLRHMVVDGVSGVAAGVRDWSAHVWDWGH
ncbi:hypothetical protein SFC76_10690 [Sphingomonas sp. CD22]|uniref:hypothetical protein n=1 Tax=Sphingomonas sp. CD22 TaxID=3100214 RepID=UPI002ADF39FB|nr:hypothetical protein [Sphingomonas sp. CD22]MEA1084729.1 hypothetical protein [Sphingomonas sp. CD22]